jgi:hypothetical protein
MAMLKKAYLTSPNAVVAIAETKSGTGKKDENEIQFQT